MNLSKKIVSSLAGVALAGSAFANTITLAPVVSPTELAEFNGQVQVLEIRKDEAEFLENRIPGSVRLGYGAFRGPANNPGQLFELNEFAKALGSVGLSVDQPLVVVHDGSDATDFGAAARVYWSLKSVGFENLSILNGGFNAYAAAKFPTVSGAPQVTPTTLDLNFNDAWYASTQSIQDGLDSGESRLLDSRTPAFFEGQAWHGKAKRPGTLPGADNFAFTAFFDEAKLKTQGEVNQVVAANGLNVPQTVSYCNTGHWAATNWFVLSEVAQIPEVSLYAESMVEWSNSDLAMDNVPGPLEFALLKTKKWFGALGN